jgi:hypothetical protein
MTEVERLTVAQVADRIGVAASTWRSYVARGQAPKPDGHYDARTPWWLAEVVDAWRATHPRPVRARRASAGRVVEPTVPVR